MRENTHNRFDTWIMIMTMIMSLVMVVVISIMNIIMNSANQTQAVLEWHQTDTWLFGAHTCQTRSARQAPDCFVMAPDKHMAPSKHKVQGFRMILRF